jgi:hypothetical protein
MQWALMSRDNKCRHPFFKKKKKSEIGGRLQTEGRERTCMRQYKWTCALVEAVEGEEGEVTDQRKASSHRCWWYRMKPDVQGRRCAGLLSLSRALGWDPGVCEWSKAWSGSKGSGWRRLCGSSGWASGRGGKMAWLEELKNW